MVNKMMTDMLNELMVSNYKVSNLKNITASTFEKHISSKIGVVDYEEEGYTKAELDQQRDLSVKFHWGHNHDFGDFSLSGRMGDRHITLMAKFCELFSIDPKSFNGKEVFDIGCWTGGTTLLLAALQAKVFAIDEVNKYADMTKFLTTSFGCKERVNVEARSVYSCNVDDLYNRFDVIYFPGVIYHLSDPVLSLRILYNSCKLGGYILVETEGVDSEKSICNFEGSQVFRDGSKEELNRGGWNWFVPSSAALKSMLYAAGFDEIESVYVSDTSRVFAMAKKTKEVGITKAGLSIQDIL